MVELTKLLPSLKFAPHVFFAIAVASGVGLFGPARLTETLGFEPVLAVHRTWIGIAFILSAALYVSSIGARAFEFVKPLLVEAWQVFLWKKQLKTLSPPEQEVLAEYVRRDTTTLPLPINSGVAQGLVAKNILYRASNMSYPGSRSFDFNVQPWAWRYLKANPRLIAAADPDDTTIA